MTPALGREVAVALDLGLDGAKEVRCGGPALRYFGRLDGGSDPRQGTVHKWQRALEAAGVRFIDADDHDDPGVRLRA
jgi:hypothetical protein